MSSRRLAVLCVSGFLLAGCNGSDDEPTGEASAAPTAPSTASAECLPYDGPPDGSAKHPYLKRAMALDCREDVQRLQSALGIPADGHFDNATASAVIKRQAPYECIEANDGQVGPQTWSLIVDGVDPCKPVTGSKTPEAMPTWARCTSGATEWGLHTEDDTILRRCGNTLELVYDGATHKAVVQELGSSACGEFDEPFSANSGRSTICISDARTTDGIQATSTEDQDQTPWQSEVDGHYLKPA